MNKVYKVIWSKVKNCYVVASELAKSHTKSPKSGIVGYASLASLESKINTDLSKGFVAGVFPMVNTPVVKSSDFKITVAAIVKNEAENVPTWVQSARSCADEIVVVDTGSTDGTVERFADYGIKCFHYDWNDDFASAKNYMISLCHGDWIVLLDGDEWFREGCDVRKAIAKHHGNSITKAIIADWICLDKDRGNAVMFSGGAVRAFRNQPDVRYFRKVHENLTINYENFAFEPEFKMYHTGYSGSMNRSKHERNLRIMRTMFDFDNGKVEFPTDWRYIEDTYAGLGQFDKALWAADKMISYGVQEYSAAAWITKFNVLFAMKTPLEEMKKQFEYCFRTVPSVSGFRFLASIYYFRNGLVAEGLDNYIEGLRMLMGPQDKVAMEHTYWRMYMPEASALASAVYLQNKQVEASLYACKVSEQYCGKANWTDTALADVHRVINGSVDISFNDVIAKVLPKLQRVGKGVLATALLSTLIVGALSCGAVMPAYAQTIDSQTLDTTSLAPKVQFLANNNHLLIMSDRSFYYNAIGNVVIYDDTNGSNSLTSGLSNSISQIFNVPTSSLQVSFSGNSFTVSNLVEAGVTHLSHPLGDLDMPFYPNNLASPPTFTFTRMTDANGTPCWGLTNATPISTYTFPSNPNNTITYMPGKDGEMLFSVSYNNNSATLGMLNAPYDNLVVNNSTVTASDSVIASNISSTNSSISANTITTTNGDINASTSDLTATESIESAGVVKAKSVNTPVLRGTGTNMSTLGGGLTVSGQVKGVANATESTDAVNLGQLNSALAGVGGIVGEVEQTNNSATGNYSTVTGGQCNTASGDYSSVSGGRCNIASCTTSSVSGGYQNVASGRYSSVSGGACNEASGSNSSVTGGNDNTASACYSSVSGGSTNIATGCYSSVSGGTTNEARGNYSSVSGGCGNTASGSDSTVSGGICNTASGIYAVVSGGAYNTAVGNMSSVFGANESEANGISSTILGGCSNYAYADYSVAIGGGITGNASCSSSAKGSVAIGADATTTRDYEVAIGSACAPVKIGGNLTVTGANTVTDGTNTKTWSDIIKGYTLPTATSSALGGVKIGSNITISDGTISLTKANVTSALGYTPPTADTNTHYTSGLYVGSGTKANAATTNGNTKIALYDDNTARNTITIKGTGATSVTSDANGVITINSTDNNTTYSAFTGASASAAGSAGLVKAPSAGDQTKFLRGDGTWAADNDTTYSAATSSALGLVKIGSNITNSSGTISLTKANVTSALGYTPPTADTDTHYTSHLYAGSGTAANAATTNGNTKIALYDNSTAREALTIKGTGGTTVTSDANGVITINSTDANTTYSAGNGVSLSGTTFSAKPYNGITVDSNGIGVKAGTNVTVNSNGVSVTGSGSVASGNTGLISGGTLFTEGRITADGTFAKKANSIATNITALDTASKNAIKGLSVSGTTITYTKGDGSTGTITTQDTNTTYSAFTGATSSASGTAGLVKAPVAGDQNKFLRGDGTWATDNNTTYSAGTGLSLSGTTFSVNTNGSVASGNTGVLNGGTVYSEVRPTADGTFAKKANTTAANITALDTAAKNAIKALSVSGQTITYTKGDGTTGTITTQDTNTTYDNMSATELSTGTATTARSISAKTIADYVTGKVSAETTARTSAVSSEATTRANADTALGTRIDGTIKDLSVSGRTITYTKGDGTTGTITTQDNNTTYDNMSATELSTGTATTARSISAKVVSDYVTGKVSAETTARTTAINSEATTRANADTALGTRIDNAITAYESADTGLSNRIGSLSADGNYIKKSATNNVSANLTALDTQLKTTTTAVSTETTNRTNADTALSNRIGSVASDGTFIKKSATNDVAANLTALDTAAKNSIKGLSVSGTTITYTKGDGTTGTITTQDTNTTYGAGTADNLTTGTDTTGKVWTSKILADYVKGQVATETTNRTTAVSSEATARSNADTALSDRIGSLTADGNYIKKASTNNVSANLTALDTQLKTTTTSVSTEVTNRTNADTALSNRIGSLTADGNYIKKAGTKNVSENLFLLDAQLKTTTTAVSTEATNRSNADSALGTRIDNAVSAYESADTGLSNRIGSLTADGNYIKKASTKNVSENLGLLDTQLKATTTAVSTETTNRTNADNALSNRIGTLSVDGNYIKKSSTNDLATNLQVLDAQIKSMDSSMSSDFTTITTNYTNADNALSNRIGTVGSDGNYIRKSSTNDVAANLSALDTQLKATDTAALKYDGSNHELATLGGTNGTKLTNLKQGTLSASSTDAVTGAQLYSTNLSINGFSTDINRNKTNIQNLNTSVTAALETVSTTSELVDTINSLKADASLNNLTAAGRQVIATAAANAVQEYIASQQGSNAPMAPMMYSSSPTASNTLNITDAGNGSLHVGEGSYVNGTSSIAIGVGNQVNANNSGAFGDPSIIDADESYVLGNDDNIKTGATGSFIVGNDSVADAEGSMIFGSNVRSTGRNGMALGNNSKVSAENAVALGYGSVATEENTVSVGNGTLKRRITNLADGDVSEGSSDAVTGNQLYEISEYVKRKAEADASNIDVDKWSEKLATGVVEEGNTGLVNGGAVYDAVNGVANAVMNASLVKTDGENLFVGGEMGGRVVSVMNKDGESRVITGVATNPEDPSSAANVGYVNTVGQAIINGMSNEFTRVNDRMNKIGANAVALASLTPASFEGDEKWSLAASAGHYKGETAGAIGAFYRPTENVMMNVRGAFGNGENMIGAGVAVSLSKGDVPGLTKRQLAVTVNKQSEVIDTLQQERDRANARLADQERRIAELEKIVRNISNKK